MDIKGWMGLRCPTRVLIYVMDISTELSDIITMRRSNIPTQPVATRGLPFPILQAVQMMVLVPDMERPGAPGSVLPRLAVEEGLLQDPRQ